MCYYYSEEKRAEALKNTINEYRAAAGLFPVIRRIFEKFDGKVLNCRLEKALQEETKKRVFVKKEEKYIEVYYYGNTYSGSNSWMTLARIDAEKFGDGKRIPAAAMVTAAKEQREAHLKHAAEIEEASERIEQIQYQIDYFRKQATRIADSLPYEIRDLYNIKYSY